MRRILFVCTGNTCRSSMAEGIFKNLLILEGAKGIDVYSAGIYALPGSPASTEAVKVLLEWGIDISDHKAKLLTSDLIRKTDIILTMTNHHKAAILDMDPESKGKVFTLNEFAGLTGDIPDPIGKPLYFYQQCAEEIQRLCRVSLRRLLMML